MPQSWKNFNVNWYPAFSSLLIVFLDETTTSKVWNEEDQKDSQKMFGTSLRNSMRRSDSVLQYPRNLVFGPEQQRAINSKKRFVFITGEAGSGKTTTLLAILFNYAGKHQTVSKLCKVVFVIPAQKIQLRKDVRHFVTQYCIADWVKIVSPHELMEDEVLRCQDRIYLCDEIYGLDGCEFFGFWRILARADNCSRKVFIAIVNGQASVFASLICALNTVNIHNLFEVIFFRRIYRIESQNAKCCSKLRRLLDQETTDHDDLDPTDTLQKIPWAMSFSNDMSRFWETKIEIKRFATDPLNSIPRLSLPFGQRALLVICSIKKNFLTDAERQDLFEYITFEQQILDKVELMVEALEFTGSEFHSVSILLDKSVDISSQQVLLLLYNAMSRATLHVYVICHETIGRKMEKLLSVSSPSDMAFEKLRQGQNLGINLFRHIQDPRDRLEAIKRIIVTKNVHQFTDLESYLKLEVSVSNTSLINSAYKNLAVSSSWGSEVARLLELLSVWNPSRFNKYDPSKLSGDCLLNIFSNGDNIINPVVFPTKEDYDLIDSNDMPTIPPKLDLLIQHFQPENFSFIQKFVQKFRKNDKNIIVHYLIIALYYTNETCTNWLLQSFPSAMFTYNSKLSLLRFAGVWCHKETLFKIFEWIGKDDILKFLLNFEVADGTTLLGYFTNCSSCANLQFVLDTLFRLLDGKLRHTCLTNQDSVGSNILMVSTVSSRKFHFVLKKLKHFAEFQTFLTETNVNGFNCLHYACASDNIDALKTLSTDYGFDLGNLVSDTNFIRFICCRGYTQILSFILENNQKEILKVAEKDCSRYYHSLLIEMCEWGMLESVEILLRWIPDEIIFAENGIWFMRILRAAQEFRITDAEEMVALLVEYLCGTKYTFTVIGNWGIA